MTIHIVYHRDPRVFDANLSLPSSSANKGVTGVFNSLMPLWKDRSDVIWHCIAWKGDARSENDVNSRVNTIFIEKDDYANFYTNTAKAVIWPAFHSLTTFCDFSQYDWSSYVRLNECFVSSISSFVREGDVVWFNDYTSLLCPLYARRAFPRSHLLFFLHTPFPSIDAISVIPEREEIINSLLSADTVGFHLPRYVNNFVNVIREYVPDSEFHDITHASHYNPESPLNSFKYYSRINLKKHKVQLFATPVSDNFFYNTNAINRINSDKSAWSEMPELRENQTLISNIARCDYTKGTKQFLEMIKRKLSENSDIVRNKIIFVASIVSEDMSMAQMAYLKELTSIVEEILELLEYENKRRLVFRTSPLSRMELEWIYSRTNICWIGSLSDGLNLIAKEYVNSKYDGKGILAMSYLVGSAIQFRHALLFNPYEQRSLEKTFDIACNMSAREEVERMDWLRKSIQSEAITPWSVLVLTKITSHDTRSE